MGLSTEILENDLSGTFAMYSGAVKIDDYSPQLSEQKIHDEAAAARAIGNPESSSIDGDSRVLTVQKRVEMVKAEKKKTQEMALAAALEKQRQDMLDDLDGQIAGLRDDLADVDRKLTTAERRVADLSEIQLYLESSNFDPTNERFIGLGRKQNFDTSRPQQEMLTDVKTELGVVEANITFLMEKKEEIEKQISIREEAKIMLDEPNSDPRVVQEWLDSKGVTMGGNLSKNELDRSLNSSNKKLGVKVIALNTEIKLAVDEEIEGFERMKAKLFQQNNGSTDSIERLKQFAETLSAEANKELNSTPEYQKILSDEANPEINLAENKLVTDIKEPPAAKFDIKGLGGLG